MQKRPADHHDVREGGRPERDGWSLVCVGSGQHLLSNRPTNRRSDFGLSDSFVSSLFLQESEVRDLRAKNDELTSTVASLKANAFVSGSQAVLKSELGTDNCAIGDGLAGAPVRNGQCGPQQAGRRWTLTKP